MHNRLEPIVRVARFSGLAPAQPSDSSDGIGGALVARQTREAYAYGAPRTSDGTLPTDYTFTGQRADASAGLMYYGARYYDAGLGRFISADTIVPSAANPQALNRYAYVLNNPLKYTDPTGHVESCGMEGCGGGVRTREEIYRFFAEHGERPWMAEAYAMLHDAEVAKALHSPNAQSYQEIADALFDNLGRLFPRRTATPPGTPPPPDDIAIALDATALIASIASYPAAGAGVLPWAGLNLYTDVVGFIGVHRTQMGDPNAFSLQPAQGGVDITVSSDFVVGNINALGGCFPVGGANVFFDAMQLAYDAARMQGTLSGTYRTVHVPW